MRLRMLVLALLVFAGSSAVRLTAGTQTLSTQLGLPQHNPFYTFRKDLSYLYTETSSSSTATTGREERISGLDARLVALVEFSYAGGIDTGDAIDHMVLTLPVTDANLPSGVGGVKLGIYDVSELFNDQPIGVSNLDDELIQAAMDPNEGRHLGTIAVNGEAVISRHVWLDRLGRNASAVVLAIRDLSGVDRDWSVTFGKTASGPRLDITYRRSTDVLTYCKPPIMIDGLDAVRIGETARYYARGAVHVTESGNARIEQPAESYMYWFGDTDTQSSWVTSGQPAAHTWPSTEGCYGITAKGERSGVESPWGAHKLVCVYARPVITAISPANNATVTAPFDVSATVSDPGGVDFVEFLLDGERVAWDYAAPWEANGLVPQGLPEGGGDVRLSVRAYGRMSEFTSEDEEQLDVVLEVHPPPKPVAAFICSTTSGPSPLAVTFTDTSAGGPTSWLWSFDDGTGSTARSPAHTF